MSALRGTGAILVGAGILAGGIGHPASASVRTSDCAVIDEACTLAELVGGGQIEVNEQRFDAFEIERQTAAIDLSQIRVSGLDADLQQAGILIVAGGEWRSPTGGFLGLRIGYRVRSLVSGTATAGHSLDLVLPQVVDGAALRVDQTAYDSAGRRLGGAEGEVDSAFETARLSDGHAWSERVEVLGETDLFLESGTQAGTADLDGIEIRYALPEPGLTAGLVLGAGLAAVRRRSHARHSNLSDV